MAFALSSSRPSVSPRSFLIDAALLVLGGSALLIAIILWFDNAQGGLTGNGVFKSLELKPWIVDPASAPLYPANYLFYPLYGALCRLLDLLGIFCTPATAASIADTADTFFLTPHVVKDAVLELSSKNIPRLGETYVCFIHPAQSRQLRDHPEFIEVTKYAAPGNLSKRPSSIASKLDRRMRRAFSTSDRARPRASRWSRSKRPTARPDDVSRSIARQST